MSDTKELLRKTWEKKNPQPQAEEKTTLPVERTKERTDLEVTMVEWFDDHFYKVEFKSGNTIYIPSVTSKLSASPKPMLAQWRGEIGNAEADRRMNEAAERGSRIHYAWNVVLNGGMVIYNPWNRPQYTAEQISKQREKTPVFVIERQDEMPHLDKLKKWFDIVQPEVLASEKIVYSLETMDAGTADMILKIKAGTYQINGKTPVELEAGIYIADLKTGKYIDEDDYPAQVAAYANCERIMSGTDIAGGLIIHTNSKIKTGITGLSTLARNRAEMKEDYAYYRAVCEVWERKMKRELPKDFKFPSIIKL